MLLRARLLLPVTAPPIEDGAVFVSGDRLRAVGRWNDLRAQVTGPARDLGEVILLPGFVNAHCHLDYTHFAGHLPPPRSFTDWLQGVLALKASWSFSEFAASWIAGAAQLLSSGCTTVLDFEAVPELLPEVWPGTPLGVISALEMTGLRSGRPAQQILDETLAWTGRLADAPPGKVLALAPHAPYSTRPELLRLAAEAARERGFLVTSHVAESRDEVEMFRYAAGAMFQWLRGQRDMSDCGAVSPIQHVARQGLLGGNCLLAHVNHLDPGDAGLIGASGAAVVHCPRSHRYFGHPPFPYGELRGAGVRLCLGTDSLVSTLKMGRDLPRLDMIEELRAFEQAHPTLAPDGILELATAAGARALGCAGELGGLCEGARADLTVIPHAGAPGDGPAAVIHHRGPVAAVMIRGAWALGPDVERETHP